MKQHQLDDLTAANYKVPAGEEKAYHAVIEVKQFNPRTGERISVPRLQKFDRKAFESGLYENLKRQGYDIRILHDPTEWLKAHAEKAAEAKKAADEKKKADEQKRFEDAVAAAVEKKLAELEKAKQKKTKKAAEDVTEKKAEN